MRSLGEIIEGQKLITVTEEATILEVARMMMKRKIGAVLITNSDGKVVGIFTERDLLKRVVAAELDTRTTLVSQVMTKKLVTAHADDSPTYCLRKMKERKFRHMLIVEHRQVVGIVSQRDLIEVDLTSKKQALRALDA